MRVTKIISGGQTGADQAGLAAGVLLKIKTGGWAPRGWQTETGPAPGLAKYGLVEHQEGYRQRTIANVYDADATILFGWESAGTGLTRNECDRQNKPYLWLSENDVDDVGIVHEWLDGIPQGDGVLNVAGNRESKNEGIGEWVRDTLVAALEGEVK